MQAKALSIAAIYPSDMHRSMHSLFFTIFIYLAFCTVVIAACDAPNGTNTPMGEVLCDVVGFIYGNLGRGLATIAVIVLGIGALLGKTSWGIAITVSIGISVIFNAELIGSLLICGDSSLNMC